MLSSHSLNSASSLTLQSLADGAVLSHILYTLSPAFFSLSEPDPSPTALNHSTLSSLLASIDAALEDHAGHPVDLSALPLPAPAASQLEGWLYPLLSAALLCCVYGEAKEGAVDEIMALGEDKQLALMAVISEWEERLDTAVDASDEEAEAGSAEVTPQTSPSSSGGVDSVAARLNGVAELMLDELKGRTVASHNTNGLAAAHISRSEAGSGVSLRQYDEVKERLHAELRERDKEIAALRQQMKLQTDQAKVQEQQLAADVDSRVRQRTLDLERQLNDLKRADTNQKLRDRDDQIQSLHQQLTASTASHTTVQRDRDRLTSQLQQRDDRLREQSEQLSVQQQRLEDYGAVKERLARMQQRLEVVSDLKEQYAMVEEEAREKGERLAAVEEELRLLRELRTREREWREEKLERERQLAEAKVKCERLEEEVEESRNQMRQLREEQRRWKEEQREWQAVQQRSASASIESLGSISEAYTSRLSVSQTVPPSAQSDTFTRAPSASVNASTATAAATLAQKESDIHNVQTQLTVATTRLADLTHSTTQSTTHHTAQLALYQQRITKGEAILQRLKSLWETERRTVRRLRGRVAEYEVILKEVDAARVEEEMMGVRERVVLSGVLYGVGAEVQRLGLMRSLEPSHDAG